MSERICEKMRHVRHLQEKGVDKWIFTLDFEIIFLAGGKMEEKCKESEKILRE